MGKELIDDLLEKALKLKPSERYFLVETLMRSLEERDERIEKAWIEESKRRLKAYREGSMRSVPLEEIFDQ